MTNVQEDDLHDHYERAAEAARRGDMFGLFDYAREGLAQAPTDSRLRYLQTLALARLGEPAAALALYRRHRVREIGDEDALALEGRILKDMAVRALGGERRALFERASLAYRTANAIGDGYFSALNAATTAFLAGDKATARQWAASIAARPDIAEPTDYYSAATAAETMLLRDRIDEARTRLDQACRMEGASLGARASTMRQLTLLAEDIGLSECHRDRLLAAIRPPPVIHYCGHMFSAGWLEEAALAEAVETALRDMGVLVAYGSLACGADILVAEAVLARGGELNLVLPFGTDDFIATSVEPGGSLWVERFQAVIARAESLTLATQMGFIGDDQQFDYGARLAMGLARLRGRAMQTEAVQIALTDGLSSSGVGTARDVGAWGRQGGKTRVISMASDRPRPPRLAAVAGYSGPRRAVHAILFADFSGFSKLTEFDLPGFLATVMGRAGAVLDRHDKDVLTRNTWGDAVHAVIETPEAAARIALDIQAELGVEHLVAAGLPRDGGMRISLHLGPIYEDFDPIRRQRTFYGTEVTLAARIEPRVPVGAIYVTQPFAAMLEPSTADTLSLEYVGKIRLAKDYGARAIYRLGRR